MTYILARELITTNNLEDYYGDKEKNIYKLIIQEKSVDDNTQEQREQ